VGDCSAEFNHTPTPSACGGVLDLGLLRYEYRSHSIYYQLTEDGILVVRILGAKQDPPRAHITA